MPLDYYRCLFRFHGAERYLIWHTGDSDGVFVDENSRIPTFSSTESLESAFPTLADGLLVIETPILHDLDLVASCCQSPGPLKVDCKSFLAAWNLFIDVARSVGHKGSAYLESDSNLNEEYDKLFGGNNIPAMTPPGEHYIPSWSRRELARIRKHLILGLSLFEGSIFPHDSCSK